jgi:anti-anti-sigma factor
MRRLAQQPSDAHARLAGEVDISSSDRAQVLLEAACRGGDRVIVDLSTVTYIDCRAIAMLIRTRARLAADHRELHVVGATGAVRRVITIVAPELLKDQRESQRHLSLAA